MFDLFKKNTNKVFAPFGGTVVPVEETPDPVFSEKILGDGVAIIPHCDSDLVLSPVDGKIVNTVKTLHAFGIETEDGIELLIHIGLNTVELKGDGFENLVQLGDSVKVGTPLCRVNWAQITEKGYPLHTPVVITNADQIKGLRTHTGNAVSGDTCMIEYQAR